MSIIKKKNVPLSEQKEQKIVDINKQYSFAVSSAQSKYSSCEIETWDIQHAEAAAYIADNNASTPFIDCMVSCQSSRTKEQLCADIVSNASQWKEFIGALTGQRIAKFDLISAATTAEEVAEISAQFTIPEISLVDK